MNKKHIECKRKAENRRLEVRIRTKTKRKNEFPPRCNALRIMASIRQKRKTPTPLWRLLRKQGVTKKQQMRRIHTEPTGKHTPKNNPSSTSALLKYSACFTAATWSICHRGAWLRPMTCMRHLARRMHYAVARARGCSLGVVTAWSSSTS